MCMAKILEPEFRFVQSSPTYWVSLVAQTVKRLTAMWETGV